MVEDDERLGRLAEHCCETVAFPAYKARNRVTDSLGLDA